MKPKIPTFSYIVTTTTDDVAAATTTTTTNNKNNKNRGDLLSLRPPDTLWLAVFVGTRFWSGESWF